MAYKLIGELQDFRCEKTIHVYKVVYKLYMFSVQTAHVFII